MQMTKGLRRHYLQNLTYSFKQTSQDSYNSWRIGSLCTLLQGLENNSLILTKSCFGEKNILCQFINCKIFNLVLYMNAIYCTYEYIMVLFICVLHNPSLCTGQAGHGRGRLLGIYMNINLCYTVLHRTLQRHRTSYHAVNFDN